MTFEPRDADASGAAAHVSAHDAAGAMWNDMAARGASGPDGHVEPAERTEVRDAIAALLKATRSASLYVPGNPLIDKFTAEAGQRFAALWGRMPHLALAVVEGRLLWKDEVVYDEPLGPENFAFRFFKDGIRTVAFLPGVEGPELREFLEIVRLARVGGESEDVVTKFWHRDFASIRFEYVDLSAEEEGIEVPSPDRSAHAGEQIEDMSEIEAVLAAGPVPEQEETNFANLYLSEADQAYLRRELEAEWQRALHRDVTLALLDQFEMRDQDRRRQVVDILREFLPSLLAERDFSNVAVILSELQLLANKTGEVDTQELVTALLRDMSEAMAEIAGQASEGGASPEEVGALLNALQAEAIPTLVRAIPTISNLKTRRQLTESLDRLVAAHPKQITQLLRAEDPVLAGEAARIVARLKIMEAEAELIELASRPEEEARQAAIEALTALGSQTGRDTLFGALQDTSREVRLSAARAISELRPPGAEEHLLGWVTSADLRERDPSEQMAVLRAYATVAGDAAAPVLIRILNGRRWWGGRQQPSLRASAARALGMLSSEAAKQPLEKAAGDKDTQVRSAVRVSLRALAGEEDR